VTVKVLNEGLYVDQQSFNARLHKDGRTLAFARFEKRDDGFSIPMMRLYKGAKLEELNGSTAVLIHRAYDLEVAIVEIDNMTKSVSNGCLSVSKRVF
jgi:hypothetical protein